MSTFEAELNRVVADFASELADLACVAAHQMVVQALEGVGALDTARGQATSNAGDGSLDAFRLGLGRVVKEFERRWIIRALSEQNGNITLAATALGTSRQALQRKMRRLSVPRPRRGRRARR